MLFTILFWFIVFAVLAIWYLKQRNTFFLKIGIPGPKPHLLYGNFREIAKRQEQVLMRQWDRRYGKVFGYYEGGTPVLMVSDPDLIQEICVKQFSNFPGHRSIFGATEAEKAAIDSLYVSMFEAIGPKWKRLRTISNPTFTNSKLKEALNLFDRLMVEQRRRFTIFSSLIAQGFYFFVALLRVRLEELGGHLVVEPVVLEKVKTFVQRLEEKVGCMEPFNINEMCEALSLDIIAQTAFGVSTECQTNHKDSFFRSARAALMISGRGSTSLLMLLVIFPELNYFMTKFLFFLYTRGIVGDPFSVLRESVISVIKHHRMQIKDNAQLPGSATNFIHILLENEMSADQLNKLIEENNETTTKVEKKLTANEIIEQMLMYLLAGSSTTSVALSMTIYELALHPREQEKLAEEIKACQGELTYAKVKDLPYLDWIFKETLRLHSIASNAHDRKCKYTCTIGGITIPAGLEIKINQWALHTDKTLWGEDADDFRPERFAEPLKHPMAWIPFGAGPRICMGMKFAFVEAKLALAALVLNYRIVACEKTMEPLDLMTQMALEVPGGVWVRVEQR